jgi:hypothetical protein
VAKNRYFRAKLCLSFCLSMGAAVSGNGDQRLDRARRAAARRARISLVRPTCSSRTYISIFRRFVWANLATLYFVFDCEHLPDRGVWTLGVCAKVRCASSDASCSSANAKPMRSPRTSPRRFSSRARALSLSLARRRACLFCFLCIVFGLLLLTDIGVAVFYSICALALRFTLRW